MTKRFVTAVTLFFLAITPFGAFGSATPLPGTIETVAGGSLADGGPATSAVLNLFYGFALDASGNMYLAATGTHTLRKVARSTGVITTIAGNGTAGYAGDGGPAITAQLRNPRSVFPDSFGNIYLADTDNNCIRRVDKATGIITTVAGTGTPGFLGDNGPATAARLSGPRDMALDSVGNLYIVDRGNNRIRMVDRSGKIATVAGTGVAGYGGDGGAATAATLNQPFAIRLDVSGNLFIADSGNHCIRMVEKATGIIMTVAGTGSAGYSGDGAAATAAQLNSPLGITVDAAGNLYIAEELNSVIRRVDKTTGTITTIAGNGIAGFSGDNGPATAASLSVPARVAVDASGDLFIADAGNERVRKVDHLSGIMTTVAGGGTGDGGPAKATSLRIPYGVAMDSAGNLYLAESGKHQVRKVDAAGVITTVAGIGVAGYSGDDGPASAAALSAPHGLAVDAADNIFIADFGNRAVRRIDSATGRITTVMTNIAAEGVVVDRSGNLYVTSEETSTVLRRDVAGNVTIFAGQSGLSGYQGDGGLATAAKLNKPHGMAFDSRGNLYIADAFNMCIRKVDTAGIITTVAGNGTSGGLGNDGPATRANLKFPWDVAVDPQNNLFIAERDANMIRRVSAQSGAISRVAGISSGGYSGDNGPALNALLSLPQGVVLDRGGNLYVADGSNGRIRRITAVVLPHVVAVDATHLDITFDGTVNGAENPANYGVDKGLAITAVEFRGGTTYRLTTGAQSEGVIYSLTVLLG